MNPSLKVRAAILLPAIGIMLGMSVLAFAQPDLIGPLTRTMPFVGMAALGPAMVLARLEGHRSVQSEAHLDKLGKVLRAILVADAIFILGMAVLAFLQPPNVAALIMVITGVVTIIVTVTALVLDRREQREADSAHRTNTL